MLADMSYHSRQAHDTSRKVIDTAIGVLVGLRGCSTDEAFAELVHVVHRTGIGLGRIATGLVALASGTATTTGADVDAFTAWGELIERRGSRPTEPSAATPGGVGR
ncbi:ANTAR domain protein [Mycolicibacterium hassiacum DSM 44199]|jgi:hypothetical protein|uniref:ANTAR domain protein n=2 Tax=Mycolicibacterium hassiacum TaxID=46351 RepID=K5BEL3_MYCHD|nr:ANTAR domain protein [Mycolicibacterium hassiacum DSM 44199]VCT89613.1 hypothetical protein MHAS_01309 [Mycolicibacterium hassiacum DSM 44199]